MNLGELSTDFLLPLLKATRAADRDPSQVLERFGLKESNLSTPDQWISIPRYMRIGEALQDLTDDPALGIKAGTVSGITGSGLAGMTAMVAKDLGTAFQTLTTYEALYARNIRGNIAWRQDDNETTIHFYSIAPYNEFNRFVVDSILMSWVTLCQLFTGHNFLVKQVLVEFEAPHYIADYVRSFPCEVLFGQDCNKIILTPEAASTPLLWSSPPDFQRLQSICKQQLESVNHPLSVSHRTARTIASLLPSACSLETIAEHMKMPHWTLRRKLQEEYTTFKDILEQTRKDLACSSLTHSPLAVAEIAYLTGFSSTEAFQRAFKRWTGLPPGEYRRRQAIE